MSNHVNKTGVAGILDNVLQSQKHGGHVVKVQIINSDRGVSFIPYLGKEY